MNVTVGVDLVVVERIGRLAEHGEALADRVFTAAEIEHCGDGRTRDERLAARFAAKEAVMKALGAGLADGAAFTDVEVVSAAGARPEVELRGRLAELAAARGLEALDVSLTHAGGFAAAVAAAVWRG